MFATSTSSRATDTLRSNHIPYTYWYEYALSWHGSKTGRFSLYLLVNSVEAATACLRSVGWIPGQVAMYTTKYYHPMFDEQAVLTLPGGGEPPVVLLSAHSWAGITPSVGPEDRDHYPTLFELYNGLVQRFIDSDCWYHRQHLSIMIAYMYMDCLSPVTPELLERIPADLRQFDIDWRSEEMAMLTPKTVLHERDIRDRARRGVWRLMPEGSYSVGGTRHDWETEARLLAEWNKGRPKYGEHSSDDEELPEHDNSE